MPELEPVPAATVVLIRESEQQKNLEVLLLLRNSKLAFHGGHWVFPGGRVDQADYAASAKGLEYKAAQRAAVRETAEEAGIEITESQLIHTAHWTTPPNLPRRFCTWFFVCPMTEAVAVNVDNEEILDHRWVTPASALAEADAEKFVLPRPTMVTLQDIAPYKSMAALNEYLDQGNIRVFPTDSPFYRPLEMGCAD
ncbi:MAG: NUDIX domain-containing protein [Pseudohongiellaceae bacterium]